MIVQTINKIKEKEKSIMKITFRWYGENDPVTLEKIRQIPLEGPSTMFLTSTPENCQGHGKQEKPEDMSQLRAQGRMTVKCHVASCQGGRDELEDWD